MRRLGGGVGGETPQREKTKTECTKKLGEGDSNSGGKTIYAVVGEVWWN